MLIRPYFVAQMRYFGICGSMSGSGRVHWWENLRNSHCEMFVLII